MQKYTKQLYMITILSKKTCKNIELSYRNKK